MTSGRVPRDYPPEVVERVCRLYESGLTVSEVRTEVGPRPGFRVQTILERYLPERRRAIKRDQLGEANTAWLGDEAGYKALHLRVAALRGKPNHCEWCPATDAARFEWALLKGGDYKRPEDYVRLCTTCHRAYDFTGRRPNGQFACRGEVTPNA